MVNAAIVRAKYSPLLREKQLIIFEFKLLTFLTPSLNKFRLKTWPDGKPSKSFLCWPTWLDKEQKFLLSGWIVKWEHFLSSDNAASHFTVDYLFRSLKQCQAILEI